MRADIHVRRDGDDWFLKVEARPRGQTKTVLLSQRLTKQEARAWLSETMAELDRVNKLVS